MSEATSMASLCSSSMVSIVGFAIILPATSGTGPASPDGQNPMKEMDQQK
jgi:hypothetical protein